MNPVLRLATVAGFGVALAGCGIWNSFDHDSYVGRADALVVIDNQAYKVGWNVPIRRSSSFNPYSATGRQDEWQFEWGVGTVRLRDGTVLWIEASDAVPAQERARLLGITGTQPVSRPPRSPDMLRPGHPIVVEVPVYVSSRIDGAKALSPYQGHCGSNRVDVGCYATVQFSVPDNYVSPYDQNPANYVDWPEEHRSSAP